MKTVLLKTILFCWILALVPGTALSAPMTYTYTGNPFDTFVDHDSPAGVYDSTHHLEITLITHDGYLPDLAPHTNILPFLSSWTATDGRHTLTNDDALRYLNLLATASGGMIDDWVFTMEFNNARPGDPALPGSRISSSSAGDSGSLLEWHSTTVYSFDRGSNLSGGVWTVSGNQVPEPATLFLTGAGLLALAGAGRRRLA